MEHGQFRKMLAEVAKQIRPNEVAAMKFICTDSIPKRKQEEIHTAIELWEALEERDKLNPDDTTFLREILQSGTENRTDLISILDNYQRGTGGVTSNNNGKRNGTSKIY